MSVLYKYGKNYSDHNHVYLSIPGQVRETTHYCMDSLLFVGGIYHQDHLQASK